MAPDPGSPLGEGPLGGGVLGPEPEEEVADVTIGWWQQDVLPSHLRAVKGKIVYPALVLVAFTPTPTPVSTLQAASPQIVSKTIIYEDQPSWSGPPTAAETVTVDKYFRELERPITRRKAVTSEEGSFFSSPAQLQANDAIGWHRALDEPQRLKRLSRGGYQFEAPAPFPQVPWGWYEQLDHRHTLKRVSIGQVSLQFVAAAPSDATTQNWFLPLDWPTRARRLYEFPATSIPVYFVPPSPGAGNELNWWPSLNEPVRPRLSIKSAQQQGLTAPSQLITATLENAWYQRLSEPVRRKATFGQYPGGAAGNINPIVPLAWSWIDEPRRLKRIPRFDHAQSYFPVVAAETITIDKWWRELVTPTRRRKSMQSDAAYGYFFPSPGPGVAYNWFQPLDTPTRRIRSRAIYQKLTAYGEFTPAPVVVSYYASTSATAQVFQRAILFDNEAIGPTGISLPNVFQQTVTINVTVAFNRMLRYVCKAEQADPWAAVAEENDPWSTQVEDVEDWDEEDPTPESGCP